MLGQPLCGKGQLAGHLASPATKGERSTTCNAFGFGASVYRTRRLGSSQPCEWLERLCVSTGTQGETGFPCRGGCRLSVPATGVTRLTTQGGAAGTHGPSEQGVSAWACSALERRRPAFNDRDDSPFETAPGMLSAPAEIKCPAVGHRVTLELELFVHALVSQTPPGCRFTRAWRQCSMRGRGALEVGWSRPGRPERVTGRGI